MKVTQVELSKGTERTVGWVDKEVKVGNLVTLKDSSDLWKVEAVYQTVDKSEIKRGWNNNI